MTDTLQDHADPTLHKGEPLIQMTDVGKTYGAIRALSGINLQVNAGEVTCVLGDNGAGKSTLIKIMAGLHPHSEGTLKVDGQDVKFGSPREALDHGIAIHVWETRHGSLRIDTPADALSAGESLRRLTLRA